jgi:hypothetical protein
MKIQDPPYGRFSAVAANVRLKTKPCRFKVGQIFEAMGFAG